MLHFKLWLEEEQSQYHWPTNISPRNELGSGNFAVVYDTEVPNVVMRIEPIKSKAAQANIQPQFHDQACEKFMNKPEIQASGGVAKIYGTQTTQHDFQYNKNPLFITYKEKVDTDWMDYFREKYGQESNELIGQFSTGFFSGIRANKEKMIGVLEKFPETVNLAKAIKLGLPTQDLTFNNVGLNSEKNLVAIDC